MPLDLEKSEQGCGKEKNASNRIPPGTITTIYTHTYLPNTLMYYYNIENRSNNVAEVIVAVKTTLEPY